MWYSRTATTLGYSLGSGRAVITAANTHRVVESPSFFSNNNQLAHHQLPVTMVGVVWGVVVHVGHSHPPLYRILLLPHPHTDHSTTRTFMAPPPMPPRGTRVMNCLVDRPITTASPLPLLYRWVPWTLTLQSDISYFCVCTVDVLTCSTHSCICARTHTDKGTAFRAQTNWFWCHSNVRLSWTGKRGPPPR